jgi:phosphatidylglycerol:prolipoprotein diacylglycerol transferase
MMWEFPNIDPVAVAVGPIVIRWYALAYLAGFLLGWKYCMKLAGMDKDARPNAADIDDFLPWVIIGVILGGRFGYVLFYYPSYFIANPLDAFKIWEGGMSFHGGTLGVIAAMVGFSVLRKISLLRLADLIAVCAPIGLFFGRIANFINGELYGRVTESAWGIVFPRAGELPRHPSQLYEAALEGAALFVVLFFLARMPAVRDRRGMLAGVFLIGYGAFRAFIEFFREPDKHIGLIGEFISMGQVLSLPMIVAGLVLIFIANKGFKTRDA